jgi:RHS repeat-associated protein
MNRSKLFPILSLFAAFAPLCAPAFGDPVLNNYGTSLTAYNASRTRLQDAQPLWWNRGTDLEGGIRFGGDIPASPGFSSGMGASTMGGIELASLGFALAEVDMALPTNGPAVVIGRSFNHRQGTDATVVASNGLQGFNWFQSAMPEISLSGNGTAATDILYLVYGANRFLEFKRTALNATTFRGQNGATGIVEYVAGGGGTPYDTYIITDQNGWKWVFWGGNTGSNKADWQFWKKSDPQGLTVYAGDKTSHSSAVTNGYATAGGISTLYQEFGDPSSPTERRYLLTYTTVNSVDRLTQVSAQIKASGSWGSPSGLTEITRVEYAYYTGVTLTTGTTDYHGSSGDLKQVTIRTALTDSGTGSGTDLSSGIYDRRVKYYRYYDTYDVGAPSDPNNKGHAHTLKLVLGLEGARQYDWLDVTFNDTFAGVSIGTGTLKPYSDAYYEYDTNSSTQRVSLAFFNGECGCGGGASNGTYTFAYTTSSNATTYRGNTSYDTGWGSRTIVTQPDGTYQVRYFDEIGQPLSTVVTTNTGSGPYWATGIVRDSNGRVTEIHSPANLDTYNHTTGALTYLTSGSTGGLVNTITRSNIPDDLDGLIIETGFQTGTGTNYPLAQTDLSLRNFSVASKTLSTPFLAAVRQFNTIAGANNQTTYTFTWWHGTSTNVLYTTPQSIKTTLPAVADSGFPVDHNGEGITHDVVSYLRKDGRTAFTVATDGVWTAMKYGTLGLPVRTIQDADPSISGDFDTNYAPGDYSLSTTTNNGLAYPSEATYDSVGRAVTTTARPDYSGGSASIKRIAETYYSKLADGRLATINTPRQEVHSATLHYYGPFSYSVTNHAGKGEFSCVLAMSDTTNAKADWLDETYADPIFALDHSTAHLEGSSRANIFQIATTIYNNSGAEVTESRSYTNFATSSTWTGSSPANYDKSEYGYDSMGRTERAKDPTDTVTRTVFDALGRTISRWVGLHDSAWTSAGNYTGGGSTDDLTQVEEMAYDGASLGALAVGNSLLTNRTVYVSGDNSTGIGTSGSKRTTTYLYDVRGNMIVAEPPLAPYSVTAYDLQQRPTATALYSNSSGLSAATDPAATGAVSYRLALSKTNYDSRGQVYKSERWKIDQSDGSDDDSLESLTWRDAAGHVIKQGGTSNSKTQYDRLGRAIHQYTLARNDDSTYAHAADVAGDIVLEQKDTVYDNADKTGLVVMTANIMRNYDDTGTTDVLDSNGDANVYKYTAANLAGHIQITCYWYDELDRPQDTVAYGTYGNADFDRRPSSAWLTVPSRSSTALRTTTVYNSNGTVGEMQAPKVDGGNPLKTGYIYDQAMRKTADIKNATVSPANLATAQRDNDLYTQSTYSAGRLKDVWVDLDGDGTQNGSDQVTTYTYGTTKSTTSGTSRIKSKQLLDNVLYPAQGFAGETIDDQSTYYAYNAQGQKIYQKDNNGTVLEWTYDNLGRVTVETVSALGTDIDGAVRRKETVYDSRGMVSTVTQYDATTSGSATDQVLYKYDDWGNLTDYRQDNDGVVAGSGNDYDVYYTYTKADTTSGVYGGTRRSGIRRTTAGLYYAAGTSSAGAGTKKEEITLSYTDSDFGTTIFDDDAGRVTYQLRTYPTSTLYLTDFRYGGTGTLVRDYLVESGVTDGKATGGISGWNVGFDRFKRQTRSLWKNGASGGIYYDNRPAYDDNSNVTTVENAWVTPWSSTYEVDNLNRLKEAVGGTLSTGTITGGNIVLQEQWKDGGGAPQLDQAGNWLYYKRDQAGSTKDDWQNNVANAINQYTKVASKDGTYDWEPTLNSKGFPTQDDKGSVALNLGYTYVFDAWDRLRYIKTNPGIHAVPAVVEEFRYNGLGHRIAWHYDVGQNGSPTKPDGMVDAYDTWFYFQYNERWQQMAMYKDTDTSPTEVFTYYAAGMDGYGGSSYIDDCLMRERGAERYYYLQSWRHDVIAIMDYDGAIKEKVQYGAYGRPHGFNPGDVSGAGGVPDGLLNTSDTWTTGSVLWYKDLGNSGGKAIPDGTVTSADGTTLTNLKATGYSAGYGVLSDANINNRKGLAGYEFDPVLEAAGTGDTRTIYHVRHRVLAADTGKWMQKDPLGYVDGMDLYEPTRSNPTIHVDPRGTTATPWVCMNAVPALLLPPPTYPGRAIGLTHTISYSTSKVDGLTVTGHVEFFATNSVLNIYTSVSATSPAVTTNFTASLNTKWCFDCRFQPNQRPDGTTPLFAPWDQGQWVVDVSRSGSAFAEEHFWTINHTGPDIQATSATTVETYPESSWHFAGYDAGTVGIGAIYERALPIHVPPYGSSKSWQRLKWGCLCTRQKNVITLEERDVDPWDTHSVPPDNILGIPFQIAPGTPILPGTK